MKNIIYWFSGSGNSLSFAKKIAKEIDAELKPFANFQNKKMESGDIVGIIFPIYAWGPPKMVLKVLKNAPENLGKYIFVASTYGGSAGGATAMINKALKKTGNHVSASFGTKMIENYPPFGGAPAPEKQTKLLEASDKEVVRILSAIKERKIEHSEETNFIWNILGTLVYPLFIMGTNRAPKKFWASEKCNECDVCAKICPTNNITLKNKKPTWNDNCEQCYACFHWCPSKAIEYGKKTEKQYRYHHPEVSLKKMFEQGDN